MTSPNVAANDAPGGALSLPLSNSSARRRYRVDRVLGDDGIAKRLIANGVWPGAEVECLAVAPFGDPLLYRLHGFRIALRRSEAARVLVVEVVA